MSKRRMRTTNRKLKLPKIPKGWDKDLWSLPLVEVMWTDAAVWSGWRALDEVKTLNTLPVKTTGWLMPSAKGQLTLLPTVSKDNGIADVWVIPTKWVQKVRRLK